MKIAMLLDAAGRAACPEANATLYVYERQGNDWVVSSTRSHLAAGCTTVTAMRAYLTQTCQWLGEGTVLAAQAPRGFGRLVFAQNGIDFWTIDGEPNNYLDQIEAAYPRRTIAASAAKAAAR
jgi:hypothetical protein